MSSIFKKTEDELRKQEIGKIDFDSLLEKGLKRCNLDESLELLLYDIGDALKEKQILLIEAKKGREEPYLIPLLLAYQNTTYFKRFVIAAASSTTRNAIIKKITELSRILQVPMPIHTLESEHNYFCLKRLSGYNRRRKIPIKSCDPTTMTKVEWRKIQVRNCSLINCSFFKKCKYALDYSSLSKSGCSIVTHATLIGNKRYTQSSKIDKFGNIIIIDEADKFVNNIRDAYQQVMSFDYIYNCFIRAKQLLNKTEYSYITEKHLIELKNFFCQLTECIRKDTWQITPELEKSSKILANSAKNAVIHLTRRGAIKNFSPETEQLCEMIYIIERFFEEISTNSGQIHALLLEKERSLETPEFRKIQISYHPTKVDIIIANSLRNERCSIVFTGDRIAEKNASYETLCEECGITELGKNIVKEYALK